MAKRREVEELRELRSRMVKELSSSSDARRIREGRRGWDDPVKLVRVLPEHPDTARETAWGRPAPRLHGTRDALAPPPLAPFTHRVEKSERGMVVQYEFGPSLAERGWAWLRARMRRLLRRLAVRRGGRWRTRYGRCGACGGVARWSPGQVAPTARAACRCGTGYR